MTPTTISLKVGETVQLTAVINPSDADDKSVSYATSNASAAVSADGKLTGSSAGSGTVTVTTHDGSKTATAAYTVSAA